MTHRASPETSPSFFQIGTSSFRRSIPCRHASKASARCGAEHATTTEASPMARSPVRCRIATRLSGHRSEHLAVRSRRDARSRARPTPRSAARSPRPRPTGRGPCRRRRTCRRRPDRRRSQRFVDGEGAGGDADQDRLGHGGHRIGRAAYDGLVMAGDERLRLRLRRPRGVPGRPPVPGAPARHVRVERAGQLGARATGRRRERRGGGTRRGTHRGRPPDARGGRARRGAAGRPVHRAGGAGGRRAGAGGSPSWLGERERRESEGPPRAGRGGS